MTNLKETHQAWIQDYQVSSWWEFKVLIRPIILATSPSYVSFNNSDDSQITKWVCPHLGLVKLMLISRASKDNTENVGMRGVCCDHNGRIKLWFVGSLGVASNNFVEAMAIH